MNKAQVYRKILNKLVLLFEFPNDEQAKLFIEYFKKTSGELPVFSPVGHEINQNLIVKL